jgi:hypothetical protein
MARHTFSLWTCNKVYCARLHQLQDCRCEGVILNTSGWEQCSRLKPSMPFERDLAQVQNIPLSKQPFNMQPQLVNEDVTWSLQYKMHVTRTNKRRALSLQEMELDGWFLILHMVPKTCTIYSLYFISIFLNWHLEFERALQLKGWNLRALQHETPMKASILNTGWEKHLPHKLPTFSLVRRSCFLVILQKSGHQLRTGEWRPQCSQLPKSHIWLQSVDLIIWLGAVYPCHSRIQNVGSEKGAKSGQKVLLARFVCSAKFLTQRTLCKSRQASM